VRVTAGPCPSLQRKSSGKRTTTPPYPQPQPRSDAPRPPRRARPPDRGQAQRFTIAGHRSREVFTGWRSPAPKSRSFPETRQATSRLPPLRQIVGSLQLSPSLERKKNIVPIMFQSRGFLWEASRAKSVWRWASRLWWEPLPARRPLEPPAVSGDTGPSGGARLRRHNPLPVAGAGARSRSACKPSKLCRAAPRDRCVTQGVRRKGAVLALRPVEPSTFDHLFSVGGHADRSHRHPRTSGFQLDRVPDPKRHRCPPDSGGH
jgi:hypothetical protein